MSSPNYKIYGVIDPATGEVRYVGQTCRALVTRLAEHLSAAGRGSETQPHLHSWLRRLVVRPVIVLLEDGLRSVTEADVAERKWIAAMRQAGAPLCNLTGGGLGHEGHARSSLTNAKAARTVSATWARKRAERTSCRHGHPYPENVVTKSRIRNGKQTIQTYCRMCERIRCGEYERDLRVR